jgi:hypothetical protein
MKKSVFIVVGVFLGAFLAYLGFKYYKNAQIRNYNAFYKNEECIAKKIYETNKISFFPDINREKDRIKVLVISGGGAKGIFGLRVLEYLEKKTGKPISELYDVIGGTSVGSLIASVLSIPSPTTKKAKFTTNEALKLFSTTAEETLQPTFRHRLVSGFGFFSPLFDNQEYIKKLHSIYGDALFSEALNHLILFGYNFSKKEVLVASNRGGDASKPNPVLYQLIGGITSPYGLFPPNKILLKPQSQPQFVGDPGLIINNPLLSVTLKVIGQYPQKKLMITHIALEPKEAPETPDFAFYEGIPGAMHAVHLMLTEGRNQLIGDYIQELREQKVLRFDQIVTLGIDKDRDWMKIDSFDFSKRNMRRIDLSSKKFIKKNRSTLDAVAEELLKD